MAAEPKRRHSKSRKRVRRASINLEIVSTACSNCGELTLPHIVCKECGFYKGKTTSSKPKVKVTTA